MNNIVFTLADLQDEKGVVDPNRLERVLRQFVEAIQQLNQQIAKLTP